MAPEEIKIGFDLLQLLSSSMYVEPLTLYREYIQNAADSISEAKRAMLDPGDGWKVEVLPDPVTRTLIVRDNGTGISQDEFVSTLTALGSSSKRSKKLRGFRGIGRLVGLGYCQKLSFRSRSRREDPPMEMTWDSRKLRSLFRDANAMDIQAVVSDVVSVKELKAGDYPANFFEVSLEGVVRHMDDAILNVEEVANYLSQVAPVPFSGTFSFRDEISAAINAHGDIEEIDIRVNGLSSGSVRRPHMNLLVVSRSKVSEVRRIETFTVPAVDEGVAAVGWFAEHDYLGALPRDNAVRGMRLREGNIQIGHSNLLDHVFPEARFNSWCVAEIHVLDRRLVPNGRRDDFESNVHYANLLNHLAPVARELSKNCRTSSIARNAERRFAVQEAELLRLVEIAVKSPAIASMALYAEARVATLCADLRTLASKAPSRSARERLLGRCDNVVSAVKQLDNRVKRVRSKGVTARVRGQLDVLKALEAASLPSGLRESLLGDIVAGLGKPSLTR